MSALAHDDSHEHPRRHKVGGKIGSRRQVTLPAEMLETANLKAGDEVHFRVEGDGVIRVIRGRDKWYDTFDELTGSSPGLAAAVNLEELRNEWER